MPYDCIIQLLGGILNFEYLDDEPPDQVLPRDGVPLPHNVSTHNWTPRGNCILDLCHIDDDQIVALIAAILTRYYQLAPEATLAVSVQDFG